MTILIDTEGEPISLDSPERPMFDADICDWNDGRGPMLTVNVPSYFETDHGAYDGHGVVEAPIKDVLEEYLWLCDFWRLYHETLSKHVDG